MNLKDKTEAYVPPTTKNIVDLDKISIDIDLTTNTYTKKDSEEPFTVDEFEVEGAKYRMPTSVIAQLKVLMTEITDLKFFKVTKTGMGLDTKYFVIPLKE